MRKFYRQSHLLLAVACLFSSFVARAQVYVYTPKNTAVYGLIRPEYTSAQITQSHQDMANIYPQAQRLTSASQTYNCHAYAWYITPAPGSTPYWINSPGDDAYWVDGSYIEVCNESESSKISYYDGDHSAVKSVTGKYDSKWGGNPVMRHSPGYGPNIYNMQFRKYYASTAISGSTNVCNSAAFSVVAITGGTYTWSKSANLTLNTTSGPNIVATAIGTGSGWVEVTITSPCSGPSATTRFNVNVGIPPNTTDIVGMDSDPSNYFSAGQTITLSVNESALGYSWDIYGGTIIGSSTDQNITVRLDDCFSGQNANNDFDANVTLTYECGTSALKHEHTYATCNGGLSPVSLTIAPNPTSGPTEVFLSDKRDMTKRVAIRELKIIDSWGTIKHSAKYEGGKTSVVLDISSLPNNLYTVSAFDGKNWVHSRLIKE